LLSKIEARVIDTLKNLILPDDWRDKLVANTEKILGDRALEQQITDTKSIIERMDFRWDEGFFLDKEEFLKKRRMLQQMLIGINSTAPGESETTRAIEIWEDFAGYWDSLDDDRDVQKSLIQLLVSRVLVKDNNVVAIILRPDYRIDL